MGVNRFIDYANPMYWAKMLRKGGIPKRKPYSFTVKIADYTVGELTEENSAKITFGDLIVSGPNSEGVATGIYDASSPMELKIELKSSWERATDEETGAQILKGCSLSPSTAWKIETKDGTKYEGVIGEGTKTIGDLFSLTKTMAINESFYEGFELTNDYDCVIFDGCTITFYPEFEKIEGIYLVAYSVYKAYMYGGTNVPAIEDYTFDIGFDEELETEYKKIRAKWLRLPGTDEETLLKINLKPSEYIEFYEYSQAYTENADVAAGYIGEEEGENASDALCKKPEEGETFVPYVNLILMHGEPKTKQANTIYLNMDDPPVTAESRINFEANFKEKESAVHTVKAHSTDSQKGLVSINDSVMSEDVTTYVKPNTENAITFKAIPATGTYEFKGWSSHGSTEIITTENPYTVSSGEAGGTTELDAHFSSPEASFTIRKKNYYDASITVQKQQPDGTFTDLCTNYYDWTSALLPSGQELHKGDVLRIKMSFDGDGFEHPKLYIGNQEIELTKDEEDEYKYKFMLDETTADAQYSLNLKEDYGAVFVEVYPNEYKLQDLDINVYLMKKTDEIPDRYRAAEVPFNNNAWDRVVRSENFWQTHAVDLTGDEEYFVGLEVEPAMSEGVETEPYLSHWREAVESQVWGGAYKYVYNRTLNKESRYRLVRLSCYVCSEEEKNAKRGIFTIDTDKDDVRGFDAKSLVTMFDAQTLLSMYEKNPKCVFDKTSDNVVITRKVQDEVEVGTDKYIIDKTQLSATSSPEGLVKQVTIDPSGHIRTIFNDNMKTAANPVVTLHLKYNQQTQTEEEFLKTNIAEAKEKLADAIETLEKDYDDGKEDVIEETPVKDEPDTDEADVAEAVLATEPTEDKE